MIDERLITFITLSKIKNYTKTAKYLNITQPAVTQHIKYLENYYKVNLITRKNNGISFTEEGKLLLQYANKVYALSKGIKRTLKNNNEITKKYNIGATLTIGEYIMPSVLAKYKLKQPNIDISMSVQNTDTILKRLDEEEIELAVVEGPFNQQKYCHQLMKNDKLILVVSSIHPYANKKNIELKDLFNEKLIIREEGSGTRLIFENALLRVGHSIKDFNYTEIGNLNVIKSLVSMNLGVTVISKEVVKEELKNHTLLELQIKELNLERQFNFVYLNTNKSNSFIQDFIDSCKELNE